MLVRAFSFCIVLLVLVGCASVNVPSGDHFRGLVANLHGRSERQLLVAPIADFSTTPLGDGFYFSRFNVPTESFALFITHIGDLPQGVLVTQTDARHRAWLVRTRALSSSEFDAISSPEELSGIRAELLTGELRIPARGSVPAFIGFSLHGAGTTSVMLDGDVVIKDTP